MAAKTHTLADVLAHKEQLTQQSPHAEVVTLHHNDSVAHALKVLATRKILSAPLMVSPSLEDMETEAAATAGPSPSLAGWVDVLDILNALIDQMHKLHPDGKLPTNLLLMSELNQESKTFVNRKLVAVCVGDDKGFMYETEKDTRLLDAIRTCFLRVPGRIIHRVAFFDGGGQIKAILSQLDVIKFVASRISILGEAASKSIEALGFVSEASARQLVCLDPVTPTLLCLERMKERGVSGAAVVDPKSGAMIANLSLSDLRQITPDHFSILALPVAEFLALLHNTSFLGYSTSSGSSSGMHHPFFAQGRKSMGGNSADDQVPLHTCAKTSSLSDVVHIIAKRSVHRVYVTDPEARPIGVITPTDLLWWMAR